MQVLLLSAAAPDDKCQCFDVRCNLGAYSHLISPFNVQTFYRSKLDIGQNHGLQTPHERFFLNIPNSLADWADRPNKLRGIFGYFWVPLFCDFVILSHLFCKKLRFSYILNDFFIWVWDLVLGCREFGI